MRPSPRQRGDLLLEMILAIGAFALMLGMLGFLQRDSNREDAIQDTVRQEAAAILEFGAAAMRWKLLDPTIWNWTIEDRLMTAADLGGILPAGHTGRTPMGRLLQARVARFPYEANLITMVTVVTPTPFDPRVLQRLGIRLVDGDRTQIALLTRISSAMADIPLPLDEPNIHIATIGRTDATEPRIVFGAARGATWLNDQMFITPPSPTAMSVIVITRAVPL